MLHTQLLKALRKGAPRRSGARKEGSGLKQLLLRPSPAGSTDDQWDIRKMTGAKMTRLKVEVGLPAGRRKDGWTSVQIKDTTPGDF